MLKENDKIGIVACSNAQFKYNEDKIDNLLNTLKTIGLNPIMSDYIYEKYSVFSGEGNERAEALMKFYRDKEIKAIFDISGGDIANEVLDYLDYEVIKRCQKPFFGYSDLTTVINAIYTRTNNISYLYQIRNLIYSNKEEQIKNFTNTFFNNKKDLYNIEYKFIQGNSLSGVVIGGNIRCFLKLAGTSYMPDFEDKVLFLESMGGEVPQMTTYLNQLKQIGAFKKIKGIILGTFSKMEEIKATPTIEELVVKIINNENIPIVKTNEIGHGVNSKCIKIGENISLM